MELGTGFMGLPTPTMRGFQSKAEAIQFAIEFTASSSMGGRKVELEAAKELFDFICKNVEFAKEYIEKLAKVKDEVQA